MSTNTIDSLTNQIRNNPNNSQLYLERGQAYFENGDFDKSIADFTQTIQLSPNNYTAYSKRAKVYMETGDYDKVIQDCSEVIQNIQQNQTSELFSAFFMRGVSHIFQQDPKKAINDFTMSINTIKEEDGTEEVYIYRGSAYEMLGEKQCALEDYSRAIELNPSSTSGYSSRGFIHVENGHFELALGDFTKLIELDSNDELSYLKRANVYMLSKQNDLAEQDFKRAIELNPQNYESFKQFGSFYESIENFEHALKCYDNAQSLSPGVATEEIRNLKKKMKSNGGLWDYVSGWFSK